MPHLIMKELETNLCSVLVCSLSFKLLEKVEKCVKFKLIPNQHLFYGRSSIKDGESGFC